MAKSRKRTETSDAIPQSQANQSESPQPQARAHASSNGDADRVAARAYELYLARGGAHGNDWEDWLTAEREIVGHHPDTQER